jgi:hypothetical protein
MKTKYREIRTDYVDDNGVTHMDGFMTDDENAMGVIIAFIINGVPYYRDPEDQFDEFVADEMRAYTRQQKQRQ